MSIHKSLKSYPFKDRHRSVRKRYERLRSLKLQRKWDNEHSIFKLPKEKRLNPKKRKKTEEEKAKEAEKNGLTLSTTETLTQG